MSKEYCDACDHLIGQHFTNVRDDICCTAVEHGTSTTRGVIGLPYTKSCDCKNYKLPPRKVSRTGTVYDDEIAIAIEDGKRLAAAVKRASGRKRKGE